MAITRYAGDRMTGLSTDTKPVNLGDGALFTETDTKIQYVLVNSAWEKVLESNIAKNDIDNDFPFQNIESLRTNYSVYTPTSPIGFSEGVIYYDSEKKALVTYKNNDELITVIGETNMTRVKNGTDGGETLFRGDIVYSDEVFGSGVDADLIKANKVDPTVFNQMISVFGIVTQDITFLETGFVTNSGLMINMDTSEWASGDVLYMEPITGELTNIKPADGLILVMGNVGAVHEDNGTINVKIEVYNETIGYDDTGLQAEVDTNTNALLTKADLVNGLVPESQLPVSLNDVLMFEDYQAMPLAGEEGVLYITIDDNNQYRFTDNAYVLMTNNSGTYDDTEIQGKADQNASDIASIETKTDLITVTQSVDLDTMESDIAINNAKTGITTQQSDDITANNAKVSYTDAAQVSQNTTDITTKEDALGNPTTNGQVLSSLTDGTRSWTDVSGYDDTALQAQANQNSTDITSIEGKTDFITVTQPVDLDSMESDIATNNAKVTYDDAAQVSQNTTDISTKEDALGNPDVDGKILSSLADGTRSWIDGSGYDDTALQAQVNQNTTDITGKMDTFIWGDGMDNGSIVLTTGSGTDLILSDMSNSAFDGSYTRLTFTGSTNSIATTWSDDTFHIYYKVDGGNWKIVFRDSLINTWNAITSTTDPNTFANGVSWSHLNDAENVTTASDTDGLNSIPDADDANVSYSGGPNNSNLEFSDGKLRVATSFEAEVDANTAKISYTDAAQVSQNTTDISSIEGKTDLITVTQAVNLDTMESDIATNNAKVGITTQQSSDITANNAKISYTDAAQVAQNASDIGSIEGKTDFISVTQAVNLDSMESDITANNAKVGLTTNSVGVNELSAELSAVNLLISASDVDWSTGIQFTKTLTSDVTLTFSNYTVGKTVTLVIDGGFNITWPTGVDASEVADYDNSLTNYIQIYCVDSSTPVFLTSLRTR